MSRSSDVLALIAVSTMLFAPAVGAQPALDRRIGTDEYGAPIVVRRIEPQLIGALSRAAGVPIGIEIAPGASPRRAPVTLTGLTIRKALGVLSTVDPRYEWREMGDVIVLRTPDAWNHPDHPLHARVQPIALRDIRGRNALSIIAALLGGPQYRDTAFGDTTRFSLNVDGGTVLDVLNATVSAHGSLAWAFAAVRPSDSSFPFTVTLFSGLSGAGCGVPGRTPDRAVDLSRFVDPPTIAAGGSSSILDRVVGVGPNERSLVVNGSFPSVAGLARATGVPMGFEFLGPGNPPITGEIVATGRTLRDVLDAIVRIDSRYAWREMDGVIVIRPVTAWGDADSMLFRLVGPVQMQDVSLQEAIERLARELGYASPLGSIPAGSRLSLDLPQGTVLEFANAILRAHGELTWTLVPEPPPFRGQPRSPYSSVLTWGVMGGGGLGFGVR
jgi:hypothetical protein